MSEKLIKKIDLKNGLTLEFIDLSRKVAGDRYQVLLKTRVVVPVEERWFSENDQPAPDITDMIEKVGSEVVFEQKKARNFVDEKERETVMKSICDVAEDYGARYISHPDFPKKLLLKRYAEKK